MQENIKVDLGNSAEAGFLFGSAADQSTVVRLRQVHGKKGRLVTAKDSWTSEERPEGDWIWTLEKNLSIGVSVADCSAVLMSGNSQKGPFVAAIHAGWRGTALGILKTARDEMQVIGTPKAWISPSICQEHFEVGEEVLNALGEKSRLYARKGNPGKFQLDLKKFQQQTLLELGWEVKESSLCTYCQKEFISYRQSGPSLTGRQIGWVSLR